MAREVLEAIDGRGRFYSTDGEAVSDWWSPASLQAAAERKECFAQREAISSANTLSDVVSEASALRTALTALMFGRPKSCPASHPTPP